MSTIIKMGVFIIIRGSELDCLEWLTGFKGLSKTKNYLSLARKIDTYLIY